MQAQARATHHDCRHAWQDGQVRSDQEASKQGAYQGPAARVRQQEERQQPQRAAAMALQVAGEVCMRGRARVSSGVHQQHTSAENGKALCHSPRHVDIASTGTYPTVTASSRQRR